MRMIVSTLLASVVLAGCISGSGSLTQPPNYVAA